MLKNHFKVALRNMSKYKGYTFINIAGLTLGLTICFLLFLWVKDELSYDRFHQNADHVYRSLWKAKYGEAEWETPLVPVPLAETLEREFPEVVLATQVYQGSSTFRQKTNFVNEKEVLFVDEAFFEVFTVEVIEGDIRSALKGPNSIILTEQSAQKYFGVTEGLIGKILYKNDDTPLQVNGLVKAFPTQSHLQFDFLRPISGVPIMERRRDSWGSATCFTYFTLNKTGSAAALDQKLQAYIDKNVADEDFRIGANFTSFPFEPITGIYLKKRATYVWIFGIIAFIILLLAAVNFINLATARAITRAKEIGIRKVLGSNRGQLIRQFFMESFAHVFPSMILAILLADLALPWFNGFTEKTLQVDLLNTPFIWGLLLSLLALTTVLTGAFPALVFASFKPVKVLKGVVSRSRTGNRVRQGLVLLQFTICIVLIIGTLVIKNQMDFLQNQNLGFNKEQVLIIRKASGLGNNYFPFLEKLKSLQGIESVATAQSLPGDDFDSTIFVPEQPSNFQQTSLTYSHVDESFVEVLQLNILQGRNFNPKIATDSTAYLLNEAAAKSLGWENPIGKEIAYGGQTKGRVIGVVEDHHYSSLHHEVEPLVLRMVDWKPGNIVLRLAPNNLKNQVELVEAAWREYATNAPFAFNFLDSELQELYKNEAQMSSIFGIFSLLAIFIACLGLLGLSAFLTTLRAKETSIRKVLGATSLGLVRMLSQDFLKLIGVALLLACPLAYYLMKVWLANFAYQIDIGIGVFLITGLLTIGVTLLTVGLQSIKAVIANPVDTLRSE
ncbi:MAG: ABC transporter permease [Bacteroidota bacterium]